MILGANLLFGSTAWIAPIVVACFVARAGKSAYRKRKFDFQTLVPQRILGAAGILVVVDLATLVGFTRWITARGPR